MVFVALQPDRFSKIFQSDSLQTAVPEQQKAALSEGAGVSMRMMISCKWQNVKPQPWGRHVPARQVLGLVIMWLGLGFNFTEL